MFVRGIAKKFDIAYMGNSEFENSARFKHSVDVFHKCYKIIQVLETV